MKRRCKSMKAGRQCILSAHSKERDQEHVYRIPEEPPIDRLIGILEMATDEPEFLWTRIWTYCNHGWMVWMVEQGYLKETERESKYPLGFYEGFYGGFSWSGMAPLLSITEKGKALLKEHVKVEW